MCHPAMSRSRSPPPGAPAARLVLGPPLAMPMLFVPAMMLKRDRVALPNPASVKVRLAATIDKAAPTGAFATVAGQRVPVMRTPINQMIDRLDYPTPPSMQAPLADGEVTSPAARCRLSVVSWPHVECTSVAPQSSDNR